MKREIKSFQKIITIDLLSYFELNLLSNNMFKNTIMLKSDFEKPVLKFSPIYNENNRSLHHSPIKLF